MRLYACDTGGCPYNSMTSEDCRCHCGLGCESDEERELLLIIEECENEVELSDY